MSKKIVAPRARSPKAAKVVPLRAFSEWTPGERADAELRSVTEVMEWRLKGLSHVLAAWSDFEADNSLSPIARDHALGFLGFAAEQIAARLEAAREPAGQIASERARAATKPA